MRKRVGIIKRIFTLLLVFLFSINSFAAVVSDNDGSAFISKAEFDSLKNSFQSQIDSYNTSIDSKIDGAIAAYLAGVRNAMPWNIKNKNMKFLNKWNYVTPQSYYQVAFNTASVTNGLSQVTGSTGGGNFGWPQNAMCFTLSSRSWYTQSSMKVVKWTELNTTQVHTVNQVQSSSEGSETYAGVDNCFYVNVYGTTYNRSQIDSMLNGATIGNTYELNYNTLSAENFLNSLGFDKDKYERIDVGYYISPDATRRYVQNCATVKSVYGNLGVQYSVARQLSERNVNLSPTSVDSSSVQVMNNGGKLIIDTKTYTELKIQNVCTVDCFNYQDKSASSNFTSSNAFNDSSYNGVTITLPEQWVWNTMKTSGSTVDKGSSTASKNNYITVQNFIGFTKASTQVLKNTTWGKPSYTTSVVTVDDGLTLNNNGASTSYYTISSGTFTGTGRKLASSTATSITTYNSTINYPALKIPKYTYKQYSQQIYDYYSNDFTDGNGDMIKWGEGVLVGDCQSERSSSRVTINYHIENMSGTATSGYSCTFALATKKFSKCVAQSGTSLGTKSATPTSPTTNTVTIDIGATNERAEMWLNAYCTTDGYTVVIDNIAAE